MEGYPHFDDDAFEHVRHVFTPTWRFEKVQRLPLHHDNGSSLVEARDGFLMRVLAFCSRAG
jgi:hypothetical protein